MTDFDELLDDDFVGPDKSSQEYKNKLRILRSLQKKVNRAGNFLFAIGLVTFITRVVPNYNLEYPNNMIFYSLITAFYIAMGFLSIIRPVMALTIALIGYISFFILLASMSAYLSEFTIVVRLVVCSIISIGIYNAVRIEKLKDEYGIYDI